MELTNLREKEYTLPKAFKKDWVDALKSGGYNKVEEMLYNSDEDNCGYCAIGVALSYCLNVDDSFLDNMTMIDKVLEESILSEEEVTIPWAYNTGINCAEVPGLDEEIIERNDCTDFTFEEIGNWIDNNVEGI